ncbi:PREDICTED: RNA exonuclease 4-like [Papilio xuthus]|uniref:RNA exonuclease 4 n=2 Tax=Papilio xuthus TaxID=66420 RepID=A0AAJ6Z1T5_PAPXU|nr:PREDICTED: RNA exonuclease 4-like [Papilio xuthus]
MQTLIGDISYILLILVDYLLRLIYWTLKCVLYVLKVIIHQCLESNMIQNTKKQKRVQNGEAETVAIRGMIDANWRKLLSSNLVDNTKEVIQKETHYTGTFRRARKKNNMDSVNTNLESMQLNSILADSNKTKDTINNRTVNKKGSLTKFVAMDCEMVGIGYNGEDHMLARVSLVNKFGDCIYDKYVKAREEVKDYRTEVSGIRRENLITGEEFSVVQKEVAEILRGRILVGHSLKNDLNVLFLSHPKTKIRDTSKYKPFRKMKKGSTPSLKFLAKEILGIDIQRGEHSSVEDARAVMQLYCTVAKTWEMTLSTKRTYSKKADD